MANLKTYHGTCHCGAVRFEAELDLSAGSNKCNCSFCNKSRFWAVIVSPSVFRLLAGEDSLSDYQFNSKSVHHLFCKHCGVRAFERGHLEGLGGDYYSVNLSCIDDADAAELARTPVRYADGLNNNWQAAPEHTAHL
jgi:hypothetical protein